MSDGRGGDATRSPGGSLRAPLEYARHLSSLCDTGKVLARFKSIEATLPAVLSRLDRVLRWSSTVLIAGDENNVRTFSWHAPGVPPAELDGDSRGALLLYQYLAGVTADPGRSDVETRVELTSSRITGREMAPAGSNRCRRVTLPLVRDRGPVFGVLRTRCSRTLDDVDLAFLNAITSQVAAALEWRLPLPPLGGDEWVGPAVARLQRRFGLSPAETRVAEHAVRGLSNKEIGTLVGTSAATVRSQLLTVYRKLDVGSRGELAYLACCESHAHPPVVGVVPPGMRDSCARRGS